MPGVPYQLRVRCVTSAAIQRARAPNSSALINTTGKLTIRLDVSCALIQRSALTCEYCGQQGPLGVLVGSSLVHKRSWKTREVPLWGLFISGFVYLWMFGLDDIAAVFIQLIRS